jgi:SAM-dependent methyltransferase
MTTPANADPFAQFKSTQREAWSLFAPLEIYTTVPAAKLARFAEIAPGQEVLDVGCGTGVVAVSAARAGARVRGLDLAPALLERARHNANLAGLAIDFVEGDAEALPYADASFDVVVSQFGHIFAPRPAVAVAEILRVLKTGGRFAFASWPPELYTGRLFGLVASYMPPPPAGAAVPAAPPAWGDPNVVRERLGAAVSDLRFERDTMVSPSLSPRHSAHALETSLGPLIKLVAALQGDPPRLERLRAEVLALTEEIFRDNALHQHFLMARATKRAP